MLDELPYICPCGDERRVRQTDDRQSKGKLRAFTKDYHTLGTSYSLKCTALLITSASLGSPYFVEEYFRLLICV